MILEILFVVCMFLWALTILPFQPLAQFAQGSAFLAFVAVLLLGLCLFLPGLRGWPVAAMDDQREAILSRLVAVCTAAEGVRAVARNRLDVPGLVRPAVLLQDGSEQVLDIAQNQRRSQLQRMELSPDIMVRVDGDISSAGGLLSLYRTRLVAAILSDTELIADTGTNGGIRYEGCVIAPPDAEGREFRVDLNIVFTYVFRLEDLAGA